MEDLDLKKVESASEIPIVVHGTYHRFWPVGRRKRCKGNKEKGRKRRKNKNKKN